jgi:hypothetical protein
MRFGVHALVVVACVAVLIPMCGFAPVPSQKIGTDLIVTAAPVYEPLAALRGEERFPQGAQLLLVHDGDAEPLVGGFAAMADANVSFDAKTVLFSGKKDAADAWQIWELTLADRSVRQETKGATDAIRPLYLPAGRFIFAQRASSGFQLVSGRIEGSLAWSEFEPKEMPAAVPLTYMNANAIPSDVLADGRILFESGFPLGSGATPELFLVYADGSGVESYRCDHPTRVASARWGGKQLASGDVVFTHGASLARFTSPLAHEERIAAPQADYAGAIAEMSDGNWLVSARIGANTEHAIRRWRPGSAAMETVLAEKGEELVEPVLIASRPRPHRHPSAIHPWDYANLLALDARLSRDGALKGSPVAVRMEMQDANGRVTDMGTAPVAQDGSFFVKAPGDRPIRFALLDTKGEVLRQEHGWFWARGGEQRYCVGCHTGPERAPENRVPAVLLRTTTPADLTAPAKATLPATAGGR